MFHWSRSVILVTDYLAQYLLTLPAVAHLQRRKQWHGRIVECNRVFNLHNP